MSNRGFLDKPVRRTYWLPSSLLKAAKLLAAQRGISIGNWEREAITEKCARDGYSGKPTKRRKS